MQKLLASVFILIMYVGVALAADRPNMKAFSEIESILGGKIVRIIEKPGPYPSGNKVQVEMVVESNGKEYREVIEFTFKEKGELVSMAIVDLKTGRTKEAKPLQIPSDLYECSKMCWDNSSCYFVYTYCVLGVCGGFRH